MSCRILYWKLLYQACSICFPHRCTISTAWILCGAHMCFPASDCYCRPNCNSFTPLSFACAPQGIPQVDFWFLKASNLTSAFPSPRNNKMSFCLRLSFAADSVSCGRCLCHRVSFKSNTRTQRRERAGLPIQKFLQTTTDSLHDRSKRPQSSKAAMAAFPQKAVLYEKVENNPESHQHHSRGTTSRRTGQLQTDRSTVKQICNCRILIENYLQHQRDLHYKLIDFNDRLLTECALGTMVWFAKFKMEKGLAKVIQELYMWSVSTVILNN